MKNKFGCTREVFLIGKYAIKIPQYHYTWSHFLQGLLCNMQEVTLSKMKDKRLCPVLFYMPGGWLIVMPRCKEVSDKLFRKLNLEEFWSNKNFIVPVENKADSFGILNGKIVALDYGS